MKKITLLCVAMFAMHSLFAQQGNIAGPSTYTKCTNFYVSKAIRDLPVMTAGEESRHKEAADSIRRIRAIAYRSQFKPGPFVKDPVIQTNDGDNERTTSDAPIVNFNGQLTPYTPPDPNGAVGPNDFVQAINSSYEVYNKSGTPLAGPVDLVNLFPNSYDDGDPIVLYDRFADRWFISEFQVSKAPYQLLVAISKTNDPTGAFYVYTFSVGSGNSNFPDYPKYSIWTDGYYCTAQFGKQRVIVLERNRMLQGSPSAGMITANLPSSPPFGGDNSLYTAPKTLDCDGALPPYGTPNYLVFFENIASGGASNSIVMYKLATDTTAKTITVTKADSLKTQTFDAYFSGGNLSDISQPGKPESIDALDGTFNFRVPYMKFIGYNSVVLCNTVNVGHMVAGIRWYELRQNDTTLKWSIYQQGTYAPAGPVCRWNGSICMDDLGDIALAYSVSDSISTYPGIRYTGRLASDPLGTMTFNEQTAISGTTAYKNAFGRCGDYSQTTLDPSDGITFWHTNEYASSGGVENTRIFSFRLAVPAGVPTFPVDASQLIAYQSGSMLNVVSSGLPSNDRMVIDLFDINGKHISSQFTTPSSNTIHEEVNVSGLSRGVYFVRVGNVKYQKVKKVFIN